jgi:hypothetical protein
MAVDLARPIAVRITVPVLAACLVSAADPDVPAQRLSRRLAGALLGPVTRAGGPRA